jgi:FKBP-type peptidyl-prolyl cis-trans isomerase
MKAFLQISILFMLLLTACSKSEEYSRLGNPSNLDSQDGEIQAYITSHSLTMTRDSSGLWYQIKEKGDTSSFMALTSIPTLTYSRSNLKDTLLDASFAATDFDGRKLKDHIAGWQIGLRKIGRGGSISMIIPSRLGFGTNAVGSIIPANTILVCEVTLVDFK